MPVREAYYPEPDEVGWKVPFLTAFTFPDCKQPGTHAN